MVYQSTVLTRILAVRFMRQFCEFPGFDQANEEALRYLTRLVDFFTSDYLDVLESAQYHTIYHYDLRWPKLSGLVEDSEHREEVDEESSSDSEDEEEDEVTKTTVTGTVTTATGAVVPGVPGTPGAPGVTPAGTVPAGTTPTGTAPAGTAPGGVAPAGTAPGSKAPTGAHPADTTPAGAAPHAPGAPGAPTVPGAPGAPGAPRAPGTPGAPGAPTAPGQSPESPDGTAPGRVPGGRAAGRVPHGHAAGRIVAGHVVSRAPRPAGYISKATAWKDLTEKTDLNGFDHVSAVSQAAINAHFKNPWTVAHNSKNTVDATLARWTYEQYFTSTFQPVTLRLLSKNRALIWVHLQDGWLKTLKNWLPWSE